MLWAIAVADGEEFQEESADFGEKRRLPTPDLRDSILGAVAEEIPFQQVHAFDLFPAPQKAYSPLQNLWQPLNHDDK